MIEFTCKKYHSSDNTPIISDLDIMEYSELLLGDYKKKLLEEATAINPEHFLESYLGATLDYQDIYYNENEASIAGATVFNDEKVAVFDKENLCVRTIDVEANTIIIDNSILKDNLRGFLLFTELHEGGHFCIHPSVYRRTDGQLSFFETKENIVKCKRSSIDRKGKLKTQEDFREHQANVFAAATSMPRPTFIPAVKEFALNQGICDKNGIMVIPEDDADWFDFELGKCAVVSNLAGIYNTSRQAIEIHMKRLGLIMDGREYMEKYRQFSLVV